MAGGAVGTTIPPRLSNSPDFPHGFSHASRKPRIPESAPSYFLGRYSHLRLVGEVGVIVLMLPYLFWLGIRSVAKKARMELREWMAMLLDWKVGRKNLRELGRREQRGA